MAIRITRSATRSRASALLTPASVFDNPAPKSPATLPRRKRATDASGSPSAKGRNAKAGVSAVIPVSLPVVEDSYDPVMIPAVLSFSFDDAKKHLIKADSRFEKIFAELPCRPFEHLEPVDPFQYVFLICFQQSRELILPQNFGDLYLVRVSELPGYWH